MQVHLRNSESADLGVGKLTPHTEGRAACVMEGRLAGKDGSVLGEEMEEGLLNDLYRVGSP